MDSWDSNLDRSQLGRKRKRGAKQILLSIEPGNVSENEKIYLILEYLLSCKEHSSEKSNLSKICTTCGDKLLKNSDCQRCVKLQALNCNVKQLPKLEINNLGTIKNFYFDTSRKNHKSYEKFIKCLNCHKFSAASIKLKCCDHYYCFGCHCSKSSSLTENYFCQNCNEINEKIIQPNLLIITDDKKLALKPQEE